MVRNCIVCSARCSKGSKLSFHRFPREDTTRNRWLNALNISEKPLTQSASVCSKHFDTVDLRRVGEKTFLQDGAIPKLKPSKRSMLCTEKETETRSPSILSDQSSQYVPMTCKDVVVDPLPTEKDTEVSPITPAIADEVPDLEMTLPSSQKRKFSFRYIGDLSVEHFSNPRSAAKHIQIIKERDRSSQKQIKHLKETNKRLLSRINTLKTVLIHLQEKGFITEETANTLMISD